MNDPMPRVVAALERQGCDPRPRGGNRYDARCPVHRGERHNLSVDLGDKGVVLHCHHADHNGRPSCTGDDIVGALGLTLADLFTGGPEPPNRNGKPKARMYPTWEGAAGAIARGIGVKRWTSVWEYRDGGGDVVLRVVRFDTPRGKEYRPVSGTPGAYRIGDPPGRLPLYRLPAVAAAQEVVVTEGEKCADALAAHGFIATTSSHGAQSASQKLSGKPLQP